MCNIPRMHRISGKSESRISGVAGYRISTDPAGFLDIFFAYNKVFLAGYRIFDQIPDIWPYVNCLPKLTDLYLQHRFWCVVSYRCGPPAENRSRYAPRPPPPSPSPTEILFTIITYQRRLLFDLLSCSIKLYDPLYFQWLDWNTCSCSILVSSYLLKIFVATKRKP